MMTNNMVKALATPLMASLFKTLAACIVASVRPAFGKMKAHQFSENDILRIPERITTVVMKKNQYPKSTMKRPAMIPIMRTISPSGTTVSVQ